MEEEEEVGRGREKGKYNLDIKSKRDMCRWELGNDSILVLLFFNMCEGSVPVSHALLTYSAYRM